MNSAAPKPIPPRRKLIEVALPLEAINRESAREKSIRHGHPSTLHLWWARRPLAACRAVLFSSLVDDPSSDPQFRRPDGSVDVERAGQKRAELFTLIEELVKWENSNNPKVIDAARAEIARCVASRKIETGELTGDTVVWEERPAGLKGTRHPKGPLPREPGVLTAYEVALGAGMARAIKPEAINAFLAEFAPPVLDPFCGGGSIPLEAQRLGLRAFASDLNPVPVLITKALIEIPPKFANMPPVNPESRGIAGEGLPEVGSNGRSKSSREVQGRLSTQLGGWRGAAGLAEDVRYYGRWMRDEAQKRIGHLYPKITVTEAMARDRKDLRPYVGQELTVIAWLWARTVPSPNPAVGGAHVPLVRSFWLSTKDGKKAWVEPVIAADGKSYKFEVRVGTPGKDFDPKKGTVTRTGATCLLTNQPMPFDHVRAEGKAGRMGARLMAIVAEGTRGRVYLSPTPQQEKAAEVTLPKNIPDTPIPEQALGFRVQLYGMDKHYKLFTPRQLVALTTFSDLVMEARSRVLADARACCGAGFQPADQACDAYPACGADPQPTEQPTGRLAAPAPPPFLDPRALAFVEPSCRGELPHLHKPGVTYFVTWRLADAVVVRSSGRPLQEHLRSTGEVIEPVGEVGRVTGGHAGQRPVPQPAGQRPGAQQGELAGQRPAAQWSAAQQPQPAAQVEPDEIAERSETDITLGSCILRRPEIASIVREALLHFAGERYHLHAWCVMPNHVHVVVTPLGGHTLSQITHSWKSYTAKQINTALGTTGTVWERECFDHAVRTPEHLARFVQYTRDNPVKAGLCARPEEWPFSDCGAARQPADGQGRPGGWGGRPEACTTTACGAAFQAASPDFAEEYADAVATYLAFGVSKLADRGSTISSWDSGRITIRSTFARQALPMTWDYTEGNPFSDSSGNWIDLLDWGVKCIMTIFPSNGGSVTQLDAASAISRIESPMISTYPPYYDNIGYADLSDFFYVWLRRALAVVYPVLFKTLLTPKAQELIATPYRHEGSKHKAMTFFETGLGRAFARMHEAEHPDYPLTVFYAFKQAETDDDNQDDDGATNTAIVSTGWETMLEGLIKAGFTITGTWPMRTELGNRMVGMGTNALASSIVLVCYRRGDAAPMASRREFITALKRELPAALRELQSGNIAPVDLAQAAIGPGMAVFSRYARVLETNGDRMGVRTALDLINRVLDEVLAEQEGEYDADTRWCIKWFEQYAHNDGPYGDAETLSKAMAVGVNGLVEAGVVVARGGKVRLLRRAELMGGHPESWDPTRDEEIPHWEVCQYLCWALETGGEPAAAELLRRINTVYAGAAEVARDLAYRLYTVCDRRNWSQEALAYNALVVSWPEIQKLAAKGTSGPAKGLFA